MNGCGVISSTAAQELSVCRVTLMRRSGGGGHELRGDRAVEWFELPVPGMVHPKRARVFDHCWGDMHLRVGVPVDGSVGPPVGVTTDDVESGIVGNQWFDELWVGEAVYPLPSGNGVTNGWVVHGHHDGLVAQCRPAAERAQGADVGLGEGAGGANDGLKACGGEGYDCCAASEDYGTRGARGGEGAKRSCEGFDECVGAEVDIVVAGNEGDAVRLDLDVGEHFGEHLVLSRGAVFGEVTADDDVIGFLFDRGLERARGSSPAPFRVQRSSEAEKGKAQPLRGGTPTQIFLQQVQIPKGLGRAAAVVAVTAGMLAACSAILDLNADQCTSDADCEALEPGTKCDLAANLCIRTGIDGGQDGKPDADVQDSPTETGEDAPIEAGLKACVEPDADNYDGAGDPCNATNKPATTINSEITDDFTLNCEKDWIIQGTVPITSGATLTIEAGTTLKFDAATRGTLVVRRGGKLVAVGNEHQPVVFTSTENQPPEGAWGGVIMLGNAPVNLKNGGTPTTGTIPGIANSEYGGSDDTDSSGRLGYVRIEYPGRELENGNPASAPAGLTMAGVGSGTVINRVQTRMPGADCFRFLGGTVNAKYLACQMNNYGRSGISWSDGWVGKLQLLRDTSPSAPAQDNHGLVGANDTTGTTNTPRSAPTLFNITLCGPSVEYGGEQYAILPEKATRGSVFNLVATGYEAGWDVRDNGTVLELKNSIFFDHEVKPIAYEENGSNSTTQADDDAAFDEIATFNLPINDNAVTDPKLDGCRNASAPDFSPGVPLTSNAATPPNDGFFEPAAYVGAMDRCGTWTTEPWLEWSAN